MPQTCALLGGFSSRVETPLLTVCLDRLYASIQKSKALGEWLGKPATNGVLDLETPRDLCRLWSAMQFIFLTPTPEQIEGTKLSDKQTFGDGFSWAGVTLLHICGFRSRFEALDFVYYILRMQMIAPTNLFVDVKKTKKSKLTPEQEVRSLRPTATVWYWSNHLESVIPVCETDT